MSQEEFFRRSSHVREPQELRLDETTEQLTALGWVCCQGQVVAHHVEEALGEATLVIVIDDSRAYVALSAGREDVWQESHSGSHQPMARQPPQKQHDCDLRLASAGAR